MGKIFDALQKSTAKTTTGLAPQAGRVEEREDAPAKKAGEGDTPVLEKMPQPGSEGSSPATKPREVDLKRLPSLAEAPSKTAGLVPTDRVSRDLVAVHAPHSFEAEQFRMLRTNLLFPKLGTPPPRTLLITSALPGEGKSFVSANLAATIAQNVDHRVLLIDADMRRPTIHHLFGLEGKKGLSDYLSNGRPIPELLLGSYSPRLSILPGGAPPHNPAELLSSRRMAALLQEVKTRYNDRFVIIDSPPPHITSEGNALAQFVDGIIIVVKIDTTPRDLVVDLIAKFKKEKIAGVVANYMKPGAQTYYGSKKYAKRYVGQYAAASKNIGLKNPPSGSEKRPVIK